MFEISFQFASILIPIAIPFLFAAALTDDRDIRSILLFFCWGLAAGGLSFAIENAFVASHGRPPELYDAVAPAVEEICKGLPLLLFLDQKKYPQIARSAVVAAMMGGFGFALQESLYIFSLSAHTRSDVDILLVRSLTTALMHGMCTATVGLGLLLVNRHIGRKRFAAMLAIIPFALAAGIHSLYNIMVQTAIYPMAMLLPLGMFFAIWGFLKRTDSPGQMT